MSAAADREPNYVQRLIRLVWPNLALILVSSAIVCAGALLVVLVGGGVTPISFLLWGAVVGPLFAALLAQIDDAFRSRIDPPVFSFFRYLRGVWRLGLAFGIIPAATAAACLVALEVVHLSGNWTALVPAVVSGSVTVLACLAYLVALPLAFAFPQLRGRRLAVLALHVAARKPVPLIGVVALIVILIVLSAQFSTALILLLPGPLSVVVVAAVWTSAHGVGIDPDEPEET